MNANRFENVFVLCTGRCGSTTLARAFAHAENYSTGHESRTYFCGADRFAYPEAHIEVDNRLSWFLGRLGRKFGDAPLYVHLTRDVEEVVGSFVKRADRGIMLAYRTEILMGAARHNSTAAAEDFARDYVDTVTENIAAFLRDKPNTLRFRLEHAASDFAEMWDRLGARGDFDRGLGEWTIRHNASPTR